MFIVMKSNESNDLAIRALSTSTGLSRSKVSKKEAAALPKMMLNTNLADATPELKDLAATNRWHEKVEKKLEDWEHFTVKTWWLGLILLRVLEDSIHQDTPSQMWVEHHWIPLGKMKASWGRRNPTLFQPPVPKQGVILSAKTLIPLLKKRMNTLYVTSDDEQMRIVQGGAPPVINGLQYVIIPTTIDISPINHSYWTYWHQLNELWHQPVPHMWGSSKMDLGSDLLHGIPWP